MIFEKKPSFERSWKSLDSQRRIRAEAALKALIQFFEGGPKPEGLDLKKLRDYFWEIRMDLKDRILFRLLRDRVEFVIIGNHDEIRRALKRR